MLFRKSGILRNLDLSSFVQNSDPEFDGLYWEDDSDRNVIFFDKNDPKAPNQNNTRVVLENNMIFRAASLPKLIERVTNEKPVGTEDLQKPL